MSFGKCVFYPLHQLGWSLTPKSKESMNSQLQNKRKTLPRSPLKRDKWTNVGKSLWTIQNTAPHFFAHIHVATIDGPQGRSSCAAACKLSAAARRRSQSHASSLCTNRQKRGAARPRWNRVRNEKLFVWTMSTLRLKFTASGEGKGEWLDWACFHPPPHLPYEINKDWMHYGIVPLRAYILKVGFRGFKRKTPILWLTCSWFQIFHFLDFSLRYVGTWKVKNQNWCRRIE